MASPNTLAIRQERLYTKTGLPTALLLNRNLREKRRAAWEAKHGKDAMLKKAREISTGVSDARSSTA